MTWLIEPLIYGVLETNRGVKQQQHGRTVSKTITQQIRRSIPHPWPFENMFYAVNYKNDLWPMHCLEPAWKLKTWGVFPSANSAFFCGVVVVLVLEVMSAFRFFQVDRRLFAQITALHMLVLFLVSSMMRLMLYDLEWLSLHNCAFLTVHSLNFLIS